MGEHLSPCMSTRSLSRVFFGKSTVLTSGEFSSASSWPVRSSLNSQTRTMCTPMIPPPMDLSISSRSTTNKITTIRMTIRRTSVHHDHHEHHENHKKIEPELVHKHKEEVHKEQVHKEEVMHKEEVHKEEVHKEKVHKEGKHATEPSR